MCQKPFDKNFTKTTGVFVCSLYVITGIVMMGFGISIKATPEYFLSVYGYHGLDVNIISGGILQAPAVFMIIVSVLSITSGILGIYGFICENEIALKIFAAIQAALIIINIVLIIFTAVYPSKNLMRQEMKASMVKSFASHDVSVDDKGVVVDWPTRVSDRAWAVTQLQTSCCGIDGPEDYLELKQDNRTEAVPGFGNKCLPVPLSCCKTKSDSSPTTISSVEQCINNNTLFINHKACLSSVVVFYAYSAVSVYRISPILIMFEIGLLFLTAKFLYDAKNSYEGFE